MYVATKAPNQTRTIYLAFDYSGVNDDVSAIRVIDGASDKKDKCAFIPNQIAAKAAPQQGDVNGLREQRSIADAERLRQENLRLQAELAKKEAEAKAAEADAKRQAEIKVAAAQAEVNARSYTQQQIEAAAEKARQETRRLQQQQAEVNSKLQQQAAIIAKLQTELAIVFGLGDLANIHTAYAANHDRFVQQFVGKLFSAKMPVLSIHQDFNSISNVFLGLDEINGAGDVNCTDLTDLPDFTKGELVTVRGTIKDQSFGAIVLTECLISN